MDTPQIIVPKASQDDSVFSWRNKLTPSEYYEVLVKLAMDEGVATGEEIMQWTSAWKTLGLGMEQTLDMFERTLKSKAISIETKLYWDKKNRAANEDEQAQILDKAIHANNKKK